MVLTNVEMEREGVREEAREGVDFFCFLWEAVGNFEYLLLFLRLGESALGSEC